LSSCGTACSKQQLTRTQTVGSLCTLVVSELFQHINKPHLHCRCYCCCYHYNHTRHNTPRSLVMYTPLATPSANSSQTPPQGSQDRKALLQYPLQTGQDWAHSFRLLVEEMLGQTIAAAAAAAAAHRSRALYAQCVCSCDCCSGETNSETADRRQPMASLLPLCRQHRLRPHLPLLGL